MSLFQLESFGGEVAKLWESRMASSFEELNSYRQRCSSKLGQLSREACLHTCVLMWIFARQSEKLQSTPLSHILRFTIGDCRAGGMKFFPNDHASATDFSKQYQLSLGSF
jgi:hypothetical protein